MDNLNIVEQPDKHRFVTEIDGHEAELVYRFEGEDSENKKIVLTHTWVPKPLQGRNIASRLVQHAVDYAAEHNLTVGPVCSYTQVWLKRHPDQAARIKIDWDSASE